MSVGGVTSHARTRTVRWRTGGLALVLAASGALVVAGGGAVASGVAPGASGNGDGSVLRWQTATLTAHVAGAPAPGTPPSRQLSEVTVRTEVLGMQRGEPTYFPEVRVQLAAAPETGYDDDALLTVAFGHGAAGACEPSGHYQREATSGRDGSTYLFSGYTPDYWGGTPDRPWECLLVAVGSLDGTVAYDGMVGALANSYESPAVELVGVELLGKERKKLELVRGEWTTIGVSLRNTGPIDSQPVEVTGAGKGLKVRPAVVDEGVRSEGETTVSLQVRPTGKTGRKAGKKKGGASTLTLRARGAGVDAVLPMKVRAVAPPPRPKAGRYRSPDGRVHFTIRNGRVVGWVGNDIQTQCGGYGGIPTYTRNSYDFPKKVRIPRNGIVTASHSGKAAGNDWSVSLQMLVKGAKVTRGLFRYGTAGPCTATLGFTAKRVGR